MQINCLLEIVTILLRQKTVTAGDLALRFGVSRRTIYRDVDVLSLAGIPVYTEKGKGGGISLLPEFVLSKSLLSEQEQDEILSALQGISKVKTHEANNTLQKLSALFNKSASGWLEVDFTNWSFQSGDVFDDFKRAILERRIAEFDYYSSYGELTHRRIEPIQLWFKSKSWYVKGFCLMRQDVRLFKLTRVRDLRVTEECYEPRDLLSNPPGLSTPSHERQDITIRLLISAVMSYRVYDEFCEDCAEKQADGSFLVTVHWPEDEWVYGTILSYGDYAEVLAPAHLREMIRERARKTLDKYL